MQKLNALRQWWSNWNEWLKAFVLALLLLIALHMLVLRWVIVESTSMFVTLRPGDLVLVQRWPIWTGLSRGDIVVFRDPLKNNVSMMRRPLLVKRIAGMPGDRIALRDGDLFVNDKRTDPVPTETRAYLVRLRNAQFADSLVTFLGLPPYLLQPGRAFVELPLNQSLATTIGTLPFVVSLDRMGPSTGAPRHIFPYSPRYPWNGDDYGPIDVPGKGDTLHITVDNLPLYDRLITVHEGHTLGVQSNVLQLDGEPLTTYVVEQDYYFVLGDSRHYSADSRYWGFLPHDHVTGRAGVKCWSTGAVALPTKNWTLL